MAKALAKGGQGISVNSIVCGLCQISLLDDQAAAIFYCGHVFHERCLPTPTSDTALCPQCQKGATLITLNVPTSSHNHDTALAQSDSSGIF